MRPKEFQIYLGGEEALRATLGGMRESPEHMRAQVQANEKVRKHAHDVKGILVRHFLFLA